MYAGSDRARSEDRKKKEEEGVVTFSVCNDMCDDM